MIYFNKKKQNVEQFDYNALFMKKKAKKSSSYYDNELDYYNFEHDENDDIIDYFIFLSQNYVYQRCDIIFSFNNQLHKYIRVECNVLLSIISSFVEINSITYYVVNVNLKKKRLLFSRRQVIT